MTDCENMNMGHALARPDYEIMPIKGGLEAAQNLPAGAFTAVTCSPAKGLDATIDFAGDVQAMNLTAAVHLAARRIVDHDHLDRILNRMAESGIRHVFVVAGDRTDTPGVFASGLELIKALRALEAPVDTIGVPCYPEGHGFIETKTLDGALAAKAEHVDYMVSQLCFNGGATLEWLAHVRERIGVSLPIYIGIPGVMARTKLLSIALRIGIGDSMRFLRKNSAVVSGLLSGSKYRPDHLIDELAGGFDQTSPGIAGLHINTFNQVAATEQWRCEQLAAYQSVEAADPAPATG